MADRSEISQVQSFALFQMQAEHVNGTGCTKKKKQKMYITYLEINQPLHKTSSVLQPGGISAMDEGWEPLS